MLSLHLLASASGAPPGRHRVPVTGAPAARPRPLGPAPLSQAQVHKPEVRSLPRWVTKLSGSRERAGRVGSGATG